MTTPAQTSLVAAYAARPGSPAGSPTRGGGARAIRGAGPSHRSPRGLALHQPIRPRRGGRRPATSGGRRPALLARASIPDGPRLVFVNGRYEPALSSSAGLPGRPRHQPRRRARPLAGEGAPAPRPARARPRPRLRRRQHRALRGRRLRLAARERRPRRLHRARLRDRRRRRPRGGLPANAGRRREGRRARSRSCSSARRAARTSPARSPRSWSARARPWSTCALQVEAREAYHVGVVCAEQAAERASTAHAFTLGGGSSRSEIRARLAGEGGSVAANGLYMAGARRWRTTSPGSSTPCRAARRTRRTRASSTARVPRRVRRRHRGLARRRRRRRRTNTGPTSSSPTTRSSTPTCSSRSSLTT